MSNRLGPVSLFKRLHKATWCAMLLMAVPLVLIIVPGEYYHSSQLDRSAEWHDACFDLEQEMEEQLERSTGESLDPRVADRYVYLCEHGWPSAFLARATFDDFQVVATGWPEFMNNFTWCDLDNWPFEAENWLFRPWALLLDLTIALVLIGGIGVLTEWRIRRRGGFLKFNLTDLFVGLTMLGIVLGYYTYHRRIYDREQLPQTESLTSAPVTLYGGKSLGTLQGYTGPVWLWKLCGGGTHLNLFYHNVHVRILPDQDWQDNYRWLPTFPYLEYIKIDEGLPLDAVGQLKQCRQLEYLLLPPLTLDGPTVVPGTTDPMFKPEHLPRLGNLAVKSILLRGSLIEAKHVETVAEFPGIENIRLHATSVTDNQQLKLQQRYPKLTIEIVEYY